MYLVWCTVCDKIKLQNRVVNLYQKVYNNLNEKRKCKMPKIYDDISVNLLRS